MWPPTSCPSYAWLLSHATTTSPFGGKRQQRLIEILSANPQPVPSPLLARELGVALRTVERDLARLRESGVPIESVPGPHGGSRLPRIAAPAPVRLTFRIKTRSRWRLRQPEPGIWVWRSPHRNYDLVTNAGTHSLGNGPFARRLWKPAAKLGSHVETAG